MGFHCLFRQWSQDRGGNQGGGIYTSGGFGATWSSNNAPNGQWSSVTSSADRNRLVVGESLGLYIAPPNDFAISETVSAFYLGPGSNETFTFTITNLGPGDACSVVVTDFLPTNFSFVSSVPAASTNLGIITFNMGLMTNSATATISIHATAVVTGPTINSATVFAATPDLVTGNNSCSAAVGVYSPSAQT